MAALSGGQAARAGLASLLLSRYDVFLLDEPTNDLDLAGLARLEGFVLACRAGTVLVSHDRGSWTRTVDRVLELDLPQQQVNHYGGGYAGYLAEREIAAPARPPRVRGVRGDEGRAGGARPRRSGPGWTRASATSAGSWRPSGPTSIRASTGSSRARSRRPRPGRPSG